MSRGRLIGRGHRSQIEELARLGAQLRRIDQTVAANPHLIVHVLRQVRDHKAALVVGDHNLGEFCRQLGCLCNHPDARFGSRGTAHEAADVVIVDRNHRLLRAGRRCNRKKACSRKGRCKEHMRTS
jgi:hypothetical protein